MTNKTRYAAIAAAMLAVAGCDALSGILLPTNVTVSLANEAGFDVEATIYIYDEQDVPEFLLTEVGDKIELLVPAGQIVTFTRPCDDLQAMIVENANLQILTGIGPDANTSVLRDGDEYRCGDEILLTFHQTAILDFDITVGVR